MAGGFLDSPNNNVVIKEVGDECFMELLSRSFFDEVTRVHEDQYYVIHDLIHDLAKFVSRDFCAHLEKNKPLKIAEGARHISYEKEDYDDFIRFEAPSKAKRKAGGLPLAELRGLQHLRGKLLTKGLENVGNIDDAREVDLKEMGNIDDLTFEFDGSRANNSEKERDMLENHRPHANLEKITISYYGATSFQVGWVIIHSKA
ncbi:hypothetical protein Ancab_022113 [Ancistrocladus abbreviatus]